MRSEQNIPNDILETISKNLNYEFQKNNVKVHLSIPNEDVYWYEGNNALPLADGRCCNTCNGLVVAQRITDMRMSQIK